jgi:hypothetical protein
MDACPASALSYTHLIHIQPDADIPLPPSLYVSPFKERAWAWPLPTKAQK